MPMIIAQYKYINAKWSPQGYHLLTSTCCKATVVPQIICLQVVSPKECSDTVLRYCTVFPVFNNYFILLNILSKYSYLWKMAIFSPAPIIHKRPKVNEENFDMPRKWLIS